MFLDTLTIIKDKNSLFVIGILLSIAIVFIIKEIIKLNKRS